LQPHHFDSETKWQFCDKNNLGSQTPKKVKVTPTVGKVTSYNGKLSATTGSSTVTYSLNIMPVN